MRINKNKIRQTIKQQKLCEKLLKLVLNYFRIAKAKRFLKESNIYPKEYAKIIKDYTYSIKHDHRGITQVLNLETAVRYIEKNKVVGCFVETGTFTGGASAYALLALKRLQRGTPFRDYWGFDSFQGMPVPSEQDGDESAIWMYGKKMDQINKSVIGQLIGHEVNKADYKSCYEYLCKTGYPQERINLIKGWFQNTIPEVKDRIGKIAILRLDGDFYESTIIVLQLLYPMVSKGGIIIIDDYGAFQGCRKAVDYFLQQNSIPDRLLYVENSIRMLIKE